MNMIHDIAPIVRSEYGSYIELLLYVAVALLLFVFIYLAGKFISSKRNREECPFDSLDLEKIDKETLYNFTIIAKKQKHCEGLEKLLEKLEPYKYRAKSEAVGEEIANEIREYIAKCKA